MKNADSDNPKLSDNPVVRIVAHNTSPKQPDTISAQKVKLTAKHGSLDVGDVAVLLDDAVAAGKLEQFDNARYAIPE
jgi:hypothetical protein